MPVKRAYNSSEGCSDIELVGIQVPLIPHFTWSVSSVGILTKSAVVVQ